MPKKSARKINDIQKDIIQTKKQYSEIRKKVMDDSWRLFEEGSQLLFKKHKKLKRFSWIQYSSYVAINEIEKLIFSSYTDEPKINDIDLFELDDEKLEEASDDVIEFLTSFHEDILERMFGSGIEIIVDKKEVIIVEYIPLEVMEEMDQMGKFLEAFEGLDNDEDFDDYDDLEDYEFLDNDEDTDR